MYVLSQVKVLASVACIGSVFSGVCVSSSKVSVGCYASNDSLSPKTSPKIPPIPVLPAYPSSNCVPDLLLS